MVSHFARGRERRYFCTDESCWGLLTLLGWVITARGVKPIACVQWPRENFWLYGACEPASGEHFFYSFSDLDGTCFNRFVKEFRASAHTTREIDWPENVVPILLNAVNNPVTVFAKINPKFSTVTPILEQHSSLRESLKTGSRSNPDSHCFLQGFSALPADLLNHLPPHLPGWFRFPHTPVDDFFAYNSS